MNYGFFVILQMMWTNRDIFEDFYYITSLHATCIETPFQKVQDILLELFKYINIM